MSADQAPEASIEARRLRKVYGEFAALHDVSFTARKGRVVGFLGPNGAGKSTTMKILTGSMPATSGEARVLGLDPGHAEQRRELARKLGYLPENGPLYLDMTPLQALEFVAALQKLREPAKAIDRAIERCQLGEVRFKPIGKLSKGFKQRVGMAQAIVHEPQVLILDEPTSGLDPVQVQHARELIRELGEDRTVLLSTHILGEVEAMADDVVVVAQGRVVFDDTAALREGGTEAHFLKLVGAPTQGAASV